MHGWFDELENLRAHLSWDDDDGGVHHGFVRGPGMGDWLLYSRISRKGGVWMWSSFAVGGGPLKERAHHWKWDGGGGDEGPEHLRHKELRH